MARSTALAGAVGVAALLVMLLAGRPLLDALFGEGFGAAYPVLVVLMLVPVLGILSFPLPPMLYALNRPDGPLKARLLGTAAFFLLVAPLARRFDVLGAAAAFVIGNALMVAALVWQVRREYRRVRLS
jgi:O-antigen/teichoic acid export membrane protein